MYANAPRRPPSLRPELRLAAALATTLAARDTIQPFQAPQQTANGGWLPFAAPCRLYPLHVQLSRDVLGGDKARFAKFPNCRAIGFSSHVRGLLGCSSIVDPALAQLDQAQARQHPHDGGAMPASAKGGRYPSSVQLTRQLTLGNEASRHELPNGRGQSSGAGVCGLLVR